MQAARGFEASELLRTDDSPGQRSTNSRISTSRRALNKRWAELIYRIFEVDRTRGMRSSLDVFASSRSSPGLGSYARFFIISETKRTATEPPLGHSNHSAPLSPHPQPCASTPFEPLNPPHSISPAFRATPPPYHPHATAFSTNLMTVAPSKVPFFPSRLVRDA
jgi:hypothetical protein